MAAFSRLITTRSAPFITVGIFILLAFGLRFHNIGAQSLWNDEGNSIVQAERTPSEIIENAARDIHPPGYYLLLSLWVKLVGSSEFALRALSAFASIITVALTFAIGRKLYGAWAGVGAALFISLNSFSIYYAQEARMYALLTLWVTLGFYCLILLLEKPDKWRILALGLVTAGGLYTQYAYALFMIPQGLLAVIWMLNDRRHRGRSFSCYLIANLIGIALFAPWIPTAIRQLSGWQQTGSEITPVSEVLSVLLRWLTIGITPGSAAIAIPLLLLAFAFFARTQFPERPRILTAPLWVSTPLALFLYFQLARPQNYKLMLPAETGMAIWLTGGLAALWHLSESASTRSLRRQAALRVVSRAAALMAGAWLVIVLANHLPAIYSDSQLQRANYRGIVQTITESLRENDAIILDAPNQAEVFNYYYHGEIPVYPLPVGLGGNDPQTRQAVEGIIATHDRAFVVFWGETERDPQRIVETTLDSLAYAAGDQWFGDVRLSRYIMPQPFAVERESGTQFGEHIRLSGYALNDEIFAPGDALQVQFQWQTDQPLTARYKVFVQLLDANGALQAQHDSEPGGGLQPTNLWLPEEIIIDNHAILLPNALPQGGYTLIAGLYQLDPPHHRLPVAGGNYLLLGSIQIQ